MAVVIAFIGGAAGPTAVHHFQHLWWALVVCAITVSTMATRLETLLVQVPPVAHALRGDPLATRAVAVAR